MKVICIGNYPPRQCGIATFTENLVRAIEQAAVFESKEVSVEVIAMNDREQGYHYGSAVNYSIHEQCQDEYILMAEKINRSGADVVLLQHEYGIFGGESGVFLLSLLRNIKIPIVSTFHTVLTHPNFHQKEVLQKIAALSTRIIIMNTMAIGFLSKVFDVPKEKIVLIEHGVPDFESIEKTPQIKPKSWENRTVMLTFGLIGRSKGIETVIKAMPKIIAEHPQVLYCVVGKTHPNIVRYAGEEYRNYLKNLVESLQLEQHVVFMDQYVDEPELMLLLKASEIYITPYLNKAQITSGTLCYAVSGGCAVFSTPYWHAEELLADGRGELFDFENYEQLAAKIIHVLHHPGQMKAMQQKAFNYGKTIVWPKIGNRYLDVFEAAKALKKQVSAPDIFSGYPVFDAEHLQRLTDCTGILQHANGIVPSFKHGYCLDDNARALLVVAMAHSTHKDASYCRLAVTYMSFLVLMHQKNGRFNNYLSYTRQLFDENVSEDAFGRSVWALGYVIRHAPNDALFQTAHSIFHESLHHIENLRYARGYANSIFGLYHYVKRFPDQDRFIQLIVKLAEKLCQQFQMHSRENWHWFEDALTYDNGLIPASLYLAYELTKNPGYLNVANDARIFLEEKCIRHDWLSLIGNRKWLRFDTEFELYAQQPIDAMAMVIMYERAWLATADETFLKKMFQSFNWFFGRNDLGISVYDKATKGCNDGIEPTNINRNQGAESTIAYLLSRLVVEQYTANTNI